MNNLEIVESFAENFKKQYKKFFFIQLIMDAAEIAVLVFVVLKVMDNAKALNIVIIAAVVIIMAISGIHIKINFGSFKKLGKLSSISGQYNTAKKELEKAEASDPFAKEKFDTIIDELAQAVKDLQ